MHHWSCLCLWRRSCWFSQYLFWKMSDTVTFMSTVSRNQWRIVKVPDSFKLYLLEMSKRCGVCLSGTWKLERRKGEVHGRKQEAKLLTESSHKQHQELRTIFLQQVYWATEVGTTWPHDVNIIVFIMIASGPKGKKKKKKQQTSRVPGLDLKNTQLYIFSLQKTCTEYKWRKWIRAFMPLYNKESENSHTCIR